MATPAPAPGEPAVAVVARVMRSRTKTRGNHYAGTFLDDDEVTAGGVSGPTNPSGTEAAGHITDAAAEVYGHDDIGPWVDIPVAAQAKVQRAVVWLAAANIELAHFTEQGNAGRASTSPYDRYLERYQLALTEAITAVGAATGESEAPGALLPRATFPANEGGLVGWGTEL